MAECCVREGLTPCTEDGEPDTAGRFLLVDCSAHGPIGIFPASPHEYDDAELMFADHVRAIAQTEQVRLLAQRIVIRDRDALDRLGREEG